MVEVLERFVQNRGRAPARVVIYRSGCSQGEYQRVLRYEIPVVLHYVKTYAPGAPLTVIVPSLLHNLRFFKKQIDPTARAPEQNIPPGTVIDTTVVHAKFVEFYLNSHIAIQGTAKTPRYTILFTNEQGATLDLYQRWTNALCYDFQIVNSPVSVPAPVYVANCYAERGRQIANNFRLTKLTPEQQKAGLEMSAENEKDDSKSEYYLKSLHYNYSCRPQLRNRRINA
jgi:eukaryotic translation initiation factor 2C